MKRPLQKANYSDFFLLGTISLHVIDFYVKRSWGKKSNKWKMVSRNFSQVMFLFKCMNITTTWVTILALYTHLKKLKHYL